MSLARLLFHVNKNGTSKIRHRKSTYAFREEGNVKDFEVKNNETNETKISVSRKTIEALERISLVDFGNEGGVQRLESAIAFAEPLKQLKINSSVKPMYSVLEKEYLFLREDTITDNNCRKKILANAKIVDEEYFMAPAANISPK